MKVQHLLSKVAMAIVGFVLLFGFGIISSTTAHAQDRHWDRYGNYGGSAELRQTALKAGYDQGFRQGNYDRQSGVQQSNYRNSNVYRKATQDYNSRLGNRTLYQRYFREAFDSGYNFNGNNQSNLDRNDRNDRNDRSSYPDRNNTGNHPRRGRNWDGYGNFGGSAELRQTALNAGYNEGNKQGQKDHGKRNNYSYQGQAAYQKGTKDYNSRLGDRTVYQRYFREAYENGYSDGVNGY